MWRHGVKTEYCIEVMIKESEDTHPYIKKWFFEVEDVNKKEFMKMKKWEFEKTVEDLMGWFDVRMMSLLKISDMHTPFD